MRCCASLMLGISEAQAIAWMNRDQHSGGVPSVLLHSVLFDIPTTMNTRDSKVQSELSAQWVRITDHCGKLFGQQSADFLVQSLDSVGPENNARVGLRVAVDNIKHRDACDKWTVQAEEIHCRYLSGVDDVDDDENEDCRWLTCADEESDSLSELDLDLEYDM